MRKHTRRRRLTMTSLIDVIFLLLLFFMLSSTFSKFAEVELSAASAGRAGNSEVTKSFLQLGEDTLSVNGQDVLPGALPEAFADIAPNAETVPVIVSLSDEVTAQRLTDVLVILRGISRLNINVLGS
ncbi:Biopolymer transport protein ExbD/TolR [Roseovarius albus]|uniref:Biopolymer transport protein ExbD/TolR n=1 Tax=Roseovarius albus TaxID=1247867 RepID=A0A1X6ZQP7_9RHOB|nr:biopolymer transporter ExbD [Roseovarius albus]SLN58169.1 Biopolymer transport protein ExbD/TolR [Roseovarius albus]